jgi:hypothetical protein
VTPEQAQFLLDVLLTHFPELAKEEEPWELDGAVAADALGTLYDQVCRIVTQTQKDCDE